MSRQDLERMSGIHMTDTSLNFTFLDADSSYKGEIKSPILALHYTYM